MNSLNNIFAVLFLLASPNVFAFPSGLAKVMSVYHDRETKEDLVISGYGLVVELKLVHSDGRTESQYVIQTVSHLSQGSYDTRPLTDPDAQGRRSPVPKLLAEIKTLDGKNLFVHHRRTRINQIFSSLVEGKKTAPVIMSSYFENFRDADLLLLDVQESLPVAVTIHIPTTGNEEPSSVVHPLQLPEDWMWSNVGENLSFPCPKSFRNCVPQKQIKAVGTAINPMTKRLLSKGHINAEYDHWFPFVTDSGMSGLPVFEKTTSQSFSRVIGLISGSTPQTSDTWLTEFYPLRLYMRWDSAVESFQSRGESYQVYGWGDFIWMMSHQSLSRIGRNLNGIGFQESRETPEVNGLNRQRCNHGSGFRMDNGSGFRQDNGSGFRMDNGESSCRPQWVRGQNFVTQQPGKSTSPTAMMIIDHPLLTLFLPPTATGMGYYFLQNNLDIRQQQFRVPLANRMQFNIFDTHGASLSKNEFDRFAKTIYTSPNDGLHWEADLSISALDKSEADSVQISELPGKIKLTPHFKDSKLEKVEIEIKIADQEPLRKTIEYTNLQSENSIMSPFQNIDSQGKTATLGLAGILTHNPDFIDMPDLDMDVTVTSPRRVQFHHSIGDEEIKTLFTLKKENIVYYMMVLR